MSASMRHGGRVLRNLTVSVRFLAYIERCHQRSVLFTTRAASDHRLAVPFLCDLATPRLFSSSPSDDDVSGSSKPKLDLAKPRRPEGAVGSRAAQQASSSDSSSDSSSSSSDDESSSDEEALDPAVVSAAGEAAKELRGDEKTNRSALVQKLKDHLKLTKAQKQGELPPANISSIITGMKVQSSRDRQHPGARKQTRDGQGQGRRRSDQGGRRSDQDRIQLIENIKLFDGPAFGIFTPPVPSADSEGPASLFSTLEREETKLKMTFPPANAFEEMIHWTEQGKVWHFPINNEQGLEEEVQVGFHEHVFLDNLLEDFPKRGPVRHFMELVLGGLSKNPYLTIAQKHDHVNWYREYFQDKYKQIDELTVADKNQ